MRYNVIFKGALVEGADPARVRSSLAGLFKTTVEKIDPLFSGKAVVIKRNVDGETAVRYQMAMKKAGALCALVEIPNEQPAESEIREAADEGLASAGVAPAGSILVDHEPAPEPEIDTSALSVAAAGEKLIDHAPVQPPDIDTTAMSMAPAGSQLVESQAPVEPELDISGMSLAPVGADVVENEERPTPPQPDTSHLNLES